MPNFFAEQRRPSNDKNFFQNYRDHVACLGKNLIGKSIEFVALR